MALGSIDSRSAVHKSFDVISVSVADSLERGSHLGWGAPIGCCRNSYAVVDSPGRRTGMVAVVVDSEMLTQPVSVAETLAHVL